VGAIEAYRDATRPFVKSVLSSTTRRGVVEQSETG